MDSSQQIQGRLHNCLKGTRVATLLYVIFLFVVFGFPLVSRLVFILHIYISSSRTREKNCHILIGCLFINLRLTHEPMKVRNFEANERYRQSTGDRKTYRAFLPFDTPIRKIGFCPERDSNPRLPDY